MQVKYFYLSFVRQQMGKQSGPVSESSTRCDTSGPSKTCSRVRTLHESTRVPILVYSCTSLPWRSYISKTACWYRAYREAHKLHPNISIHPDTHISIHPDTHVCHYEYRYKCTRVLPLYVYTLWSHHHARQPTISCEGSRLTDANPWKPMETWKPMLSIASMVDGETDHHTSHHHIVHGYGCQCMHVCTCGLTSVTTLVIFVCASFLVSTTASKNKEWEWNGCFWGAFGFGFVVDPCLSLLKLEFGVQVLYCRLGFNTFSAQSIVLLSVCVCVCVVVWNLLVWNKQTDGICIEKE